MLLIDILNEIHFGGFEFYSALKASRGRPQTIYPVFRKLLNYAAEYPGAYSSRFSDGLLTCGAFLLAKAKDPQFIDLVRPLISIEAECSLLGDYPMDAARLVSVYLHERLDDLPAILEFEPSSGEFQAAVLEASVLIAHWNPELRVKVVSTFTHLIRDGFIGRSDPSIAQTFLACCSRMGASEFVLDLQLASGRSEIDERSVSQVVESANFAKEEPIKIEDWERIAPLTLSDPLFQKYGCCFSMEEFAGVLSGLSLDEESLAAFNRGATPSRMLRERFAALLSTQGIIDVCTGVIALAVSDPEEFRARHSGMAVTTAICLAAPASDRRFNDQFLKLLSLESDHLNTLLSDDLTQFCDVALALSGKSSATDIKKLIANPQVADVVKWVALDALALQVKWGFLPTSELDCYIQSFIERREQVGKSWTLWPNLIQAAAKVGLRKFESFFVSMVAEGYVIEDDGRPYYDQDDVIEQFEHPFGESTVPEARTSIELLDLSPYLDSYLCTRDFMGRFQPPDYMTVLTIGSPTET